MDIVVDSGPCDEFGDGMERLARCPFVWPGPSPQLLPSASAAALLDAKAGHMFQQRGLVLRQAVCSPPNPYLITSNQENDFEPLPILGYTMYVFCSVFTMRKWP